MRAQNTAKITVIIPNLETYHQIGGTEMATLKSEKDLLIEEIGRKGVEVETRIDKEEIEINEIEVEVRKEDNMIEKEAAQEKEGGIDLKYLLFPLPIIILPIRKCFSLFFPQCIILWLKHFLLLY